MLLGHSIAASLFQRGGMSAPRALCTFIRGRYWTPTRLWDACRFESLVISGTSLLLVTRLDVGFSHIVAATDASLSGIGVCQAMWPEEAVRGAAKWQEKWRFRRLAPTERTPRRRALCELREVIEMSSVCPELAADDRVWALGHGFPELDEGAARRTVYAGPLRLEEHIGLKEGRAFLWGVRVTSPAGSRTTRNVTCAISTTSESRAASFVADRTVIACRSCAVASRPCRSAPAWLATCGGCPHGRV